MINVYKHRDQTTVKADDFMLVFCFFRLMVQRDSRHGLPEDCIGFVA